MTALSLALAFTSALAFAAFVLWLRERRQELTTERMEQLTKRVLAFEEVVTDLPALKSTVSDLALKAGLRPRS